MGTIHVDVASHTITRAVSHPLAINADIQLFVKNNFGIYATGKTRKYLEVRLDLDLVKGHRY